MNLGSEGSPNGERLKYSIFSHPSWLAWVSENWQLEPIHLRYTISNKSTPALEVTLFVDKHGRVRMPPMQPYVPVFVSDSAVREDKRTTNWLNLASQLADEIRSRGLIGKLNLNPGVLDARPFQWAAFETEVRYTYTSALPLQQISVTSNIRKRIESASNAGCFVDDNYTIDEVIGCLAATGDRKGFEYKLSVSRFESLLEIVGEEVCRVKVLRNKFGTPISGGVRLALPKATAVGWVQGTKQEGLRVGANQLLYRDVLADLASIGATSFDFAGANIRSVAEAKARWGMSLTPYLALESYDLRKLRRTLIGFSSQLSSVVRRSNVSSAR